MELVKHDFVNAQEMAKNHPDTFEAPSLLELAEIQAGDYIKVSHNNERFWVLVTENMDGVITGTIDNDLVFDQPFNYPDEISVNHRHVFSVIT